MLCEGAAEYTLGVDQLLGLVTAEDGPLVGEPVVLRGRPWRGHVYQLGPVARQREETLVGEVAVDALGPHDPPDLGDGGVHLGLEPDRAVARRSLLHVAERDGKYRRTPTAVAPGGTEADRLLLDDHHAQRRVGLEQVVGTPQAGVAGSHDHHVGVPVTGQGCAGAVRRPTTGGVPVCLVASDIASSSSWLRRVSAPEPLAIDCVNV